MPPGLVEDDGYGVGQIEAAITGAHGDEDAVVTRYAIQQFGRQSPGLGTKEQGIARQKEGLGEGPVTPGRASHEPGWGLGLDIGGKVRMDLDADPLPVIEPSPPQTAVIQDEAQGLDQMQSTADIGAQAHDVAGIGWDLGLVKDDIEYRNQGASPSARLAREH